MSRKNAAYKKGYEHTDFSDLLNELQGIEIGNVSEEESEVPESETESLNVNICVPVESEERHRIMSNPKVKYMYSKELRIVHDKHCIQAREILDEDLEWSEYYQEEWQQCPECAIRTYVSVGAKDPESMKLYEQFFEKTCMTDVQVRSIYIENDMKTRITMDTMTVWHKEDAWRIKALPKKGHVQLYHNNYAIRKKGIREFTLGFHIQNLACMDTNMGYALSIIENYEYKPEEAMLHKGASKFAIRKKSKKIKLQNKNETVMALEHMLTDNYRPKSFKEVLKTFFSRVANGRKHYDLNGFQMVSEHGYPKNQTVCIYIWKDKNGQLLWQTGIYNQKTEQFSVCYGEIIYAIKQSKVIAWKKMTAEAMVVGRKS